MKLSTRLFIILSLSILSKGVIGQNLSKIEQQFFTAYVNNISTAWEKNLQQLEQAEEEQAQLQLAKGYYAAANTAMSNRNLDLAKYFLDKSAILSKKLLHKNSELAEANALLSAVYGMKIGLSPMKGMMLGSKSNSAAQKAVELAPDNGFTNFVKGSNLFYTPSMWGGDVEKSVFFLEKSKSIYEKNQQVNTWEYLNTLSLLGQVYHSLKSYDKAESTYEIALQIAPTFSSIKDYLLPQTKKAKSK